MEGNKIEFCPNDDNMLYIKLDDQSNLKYYCNLCKEEYEANNKCVFKQNYDVNSYSHKTYVNENIFEDPTLPRLGNIKCINDECDTNVCECVDLKCIQATVAAIQPSAIPPVAGLPVATFVSQYNTNQCAASELNQYYRNPHGAYLVTSGTYSATSMIETGTKKYYYIKIEGNQFKMTRYFSDSIQEGTRVDVLFTADDEHSRDGVCCARTLNG